MWSFIGQSDKICDRIEKFEKIFAPLYELLVEPGEINEDVKRETMTSHPHVLTTTIEASNVAKFEDLYARALDALVEVHNTSVNYNFNEYLELLDWLEKSKVSITKNDDGSQTFVYEHLLVENIEGLQHIKEKLQEGCAIVKELSDSLNSMKYAVNGDEIQFDVKVGFVRKLEKLIRRKDDSVIMRYGPEACDDYYDCFSCTPRDFLIFDVADKVISEANRQINNNKSSSQSR